MQEEYEKIVDEVSEKYEYSDDLRNALKRVLPAMLAEATPKSKETFYKMLRRTPIAVIPHDSEITKKELDDRYIGNPNPHIKDLESDALGEYGKIEGAGALVTEPVLDENLNLIGEKQYIYIKDEFVGNGQRDVAARDLFGTSINLPHLIHELGHAWHAENNHFEKDDNYLIERVGPSKFFMKLEQQEDGSYTRFLEKVEGLILEESLNTIAEEKALARLLEMSREDVQKQVYRKIVVPSNYQGAITSMGDRFCEMDTSGAIERWRLTGDFRELDELMYIMAQTESYKKRTEIDENMLKKKSMFESPRTQRMKETFERCERDFFYDKENLNPLEIVEHSMIEVYDVVMNKLDFDIFNDEGLEFYKAFMLEAMRPGYTIMNRTLDIIEDPNKKAEILAQMAEEQAQAEGKETLSRVVYKKAPELGMIDIGQASKTLEKANEFPEAKNQTQEREKVSQNVEI